MTNEEKENLMKQRNNIYEQACKDLEKLNFGVDACLLNFLKEPSFVIACHQACHDITNYKREQKHFLN